MKSIGAPQGDLEDQIRPTLTFLSMKSYRVYSSVGDNE